MTWHDGTRWLAYFRHVTTERLDTQVHRLFKLGKNTTHLFTEPVVAGFRQYSSKYRLTRRSLSSTEGNPNSTISSTRSLMAQSNWSGWLLAKTNINLQGEQNKIIIGFVADSAEFVFILFLFAIPSLLELQYHSGTFLVTPTRCKLTPTRFTDLFILLFLRPLHVKCRARFFSRKKLKTSYICRFVSLTSVCLLPTCTHAQSLFQHVSHTYTELIYTTPHLLDKMPPPIKRSTRVTKIPHKTNKHSTSWQNL